MIRLVDAEYEDIQKNGALGLPEEEIARILNYLDRKSTRLNSSHVALSRMPASA